MINCAGIDLNPQVFDVNGVNIAPIQIADQIKQSVINNFGSIDPEALNKVSDFKAFIRRRLDKKILKNPIPDNSKENLSPEDKIKLANLERAMQIILKENIDKLPIFKNSDVLKALKQILTVAESQDENIEQKDTNDTVNGDEDDEWSKELDEKTKLVLNQLGMSPSEFKKIIYAGATEKDSFRKTKLRQRIATNVVRNDIYINDNPWTFNESIVNLKNEWFKQVCDYLGESQQELFIRDSNNSKYIYNKSATGILNRFKIKALNSSVSVKDNEKFEEAVNAFVNLISFDEDIKEYMGNSISINRNTSSSFSKTNLPYGISSHSSLRSGWSTEELTDGMKNIPHITKLLFNSIPEYKNGNETGLYLDSQQTISLVKRLLTRCLKSSNMLPYLKNSIRVLRISGNAKELFNDMFGVDGKYNSYVAPIIRGFNSKEQVIINSFFRELYGEKGLYAQELSVNRDNSKTTILDALIHAITQVDMMSYQSVDLKDDGSEISATQYLRESTSTDNEALDLAQTINQDPHFDWSQTSVNPGITQWEIFVNPHFKILVSPGQKSTLGYTTTANQKLEVHILRDGVEVTSRYLNQDINDNSSPDFNNNAITQDSQIKDEYKDIMEFIISTLGLQTTSNINELLYTMQGEFSTGKYAGFSGMLMSAIRSKIVKQIVANYKNADTDLSIQKYYSVNNRKNLDPAYDQVTILPEKTIISGGIFGIDYKIVSAQRDPWVRAYGAAKQILEGTNAQSTVTSSDNKKQPAIRSFAYGLNPRERIREQLNAESEGISRNTTNATTSLLFAHNISSGGTDLLAEVAAHVDLEVTDTQGNTKQIKAMNTNEMMHHAIFDNFYNHFWEDGNITFQPMDYADKGVQIVYTARGTIQIVYDNGDNVDLRHATPLQIQQLYKQSIGGFYTKSFRNSLIDISNSIDRNTYPTYPVSTDPKDTAPIHINQSSTAQELLAAAKAIDSWMQKVPTNRYVIVQSLDAQGKEIPVELSTQSIFQQYSINDTANYQRTLIGKTSVTPEVINPITKVPYTTTELYQLATKEGTGLTEQQLTDYSFAKGINLYQNISYMKYEGKVRLNPAMVYMGTMQFQGNNLESRWERDKKHFVDDLLKHQVSFRAKHSYETNYGQDYYKETDVYNILNQFLRDEDLKSWRAKGDKFWTIGEWIKGDYMIIAKIQHKDGSITDLIFQPELQLNEDDTLILNPLLDHYFQVDNLLSNNMRFTITGTEFSDPLKFNNYSEPFNTLISNIENVNPQQFELMESNLWNTSNKRANISTATMTPFAIGTKQGVSRMVNLATIEDIPAPVYDFMGQKGKDVDSMDGSTLTDGIQATWESWSMPGQTLGMDKKTIAHGYDNRTGGTILLKHAQYAINNERMLMARNSEIDLENVFKRMNDRKFSEIDWKGLGLVSTALHATTFTNLYHQVDDGKWRLIHKLVYDKKNQAYYTVEYEVDEYYNKIPYTDKRYYYQFDTSSQQLIGGSQQPIEENEKVETINSIYELWQALGGIDTFEKQGDQLVRSEGSQVAVAKVINNSTTFSQNDVEKDGTIKDGAKEYQPYKTYKIHYLANRSGSKRIQGNVNGVDRWFNNKPFKYSPMQMTRFGSQLDADHEVEDSSITLPTQAMAALVQGGVNQAYAREVYNIMGSLALETSKLSADLVYDFMKSYNEGKELSTDQVQQFHETIGYLLALNYSKQNDAELGDIILEGMAKVLRTGSTELKQKFKIPFSDSSLYSSLLPVITSAINKVSIKAKLAGSALVLTPGYKIAQYFNYGSVDQNGIYDDTTKISRMSQDVYNEARDAYNNNQEVKTYIDEYLALGKESLNLYNYSVRQKQLIRGYLHYLQDLHERTNPPKQAGEFLPNEVVRVKYTLPNGKEIAQDIRFDFNIEDYYNFVDAYDNNTLGEYLRSKGIVVDANATNFRLYDSIISPRDLAPLRYVFDYTDKEGVLRKSNIYLLDGIRKNANNAKLRGLEFRKALINLDKGSATIGGNTYQITNIKKMAAEEIAPNSYAQRFGVEGKTILEARKILQDRLSDPNKIRTNFGIPYLCTFTLANNKHTIISLSEPIITDKTFFQAFNPELNTIIKQENGIDWIYKIDKDRQLLYKVGVRQGEDAQYFIKPYRFEKESPSGKIESYNYYYIDQKILTELGLNRDEVIPDVIRSIYNTDDFIGVEVSPYVIEQFKKHKYQQHSNWLTNAFRGYDVQSFINNQFKEENFFKLRQDWYRNKQHQIIASFEKTLENMITRIPTATKQSFMSMNIVGFTGGTDNRVYVSHFQAWLQGSDYDIDKGYALGYNFDNNGIFIGWSNLFDYMTKESLESSCYLPIPKHTTWIAVNTNEDVDILNMKLSDGTFLKDRIEKVYNEKGEAKSVDRNPLIGAFLRRLRITPYQSIKVKYDTSNVKQQAFINDIMQHESTDLVDGRKIKAYQNALSWNAQHIINDIKEVADSYVPTSVDNMKDAVKELELSGDSERYNMMNPVNKYILIEENLTGKNVISVGANVQKSYFNLYNYFQDVITYPKDYNPKYYKFIKQFSKIGRKAVTKSTLGNLNFEAIPEFANLSKILFMTDPNIKATLKEHQQRYYINDGAFQFDFIKAYRYGNISDTFSRFLQDVNNILATYSPSAETIAKYGDAYMLLNNSENPESNISELLNAAADNAKELILNKINAGMNLAGMHGYLMSMGFNLKDIIKFMTSNAANIINILTKEDIYNKTYYKSRKVDSLIKDILLNEDNLERWRKIILNPTLIPETGDDITDVVSRQLVKNIYKSIGDDENFYLNNITGEVTYNGKKYQNILKLQGTLAEGTQERQFIDTVIEQIQKAYDNFIDDVKEFDNVYRGTKEMTALSQLFLSLNQGIKSVQADQLYFESRVYQYIDSMQKVLPDEVNGLQEFIQTGTMSNELQKSLQEVTHLRQELSVEEIANDIYDCMQAGIYKNFNYKSYLLDSMVSYIDHNGVQQNISYRNLAIKYYNLFKDSFNIFDVIQHSPQYSEYLNRLRDAVIESDTASVKSTLVRQFFDELRESKVFMSDNLIKQIQAYIDDAYIQKYLNSLDKQFLVVNDDHGFIFDKLRLSKLLTNRVLDFHNSDNIASFKYWVENQLVKQLRNGYYYDVDGTKHILKDPNPFIQGLGILMNKGRSYLALNIDMLNIAASTTTITSYSNYLKGFTDLSAYKYDDGTLQDIFMLYNLLINNNKYGRHRITSIFQERYKQDINNLDTEGYKQSSLSNWYQFIGLQDSDNIQETINSHQLEGLLDYRKQVLDKYGLSVTGFLKFTAPYVRSPKDSTAPIVRMVSQDSLTPYYYDTRTKKIIDYLEGVNTTNISSKEQQNFLENLIRYYPTQVDSSIIRASYEAMFNDASAAENGMYSMTNSGALKILVNCE